MAERRRHDEEALATVHRAFREAKCPHPLKISNGYRSAAVIFVAPEDWKEGAKKEPPKASKPKFRVRLRIIYFYLAACRTALSSL